MPYIEPREESSGKQDSLEEVQESSVALAEKAQAETEESIKELRKQLQTQDLERKKAKHKRQRQNNVAAARARRHSGELCRTGHTKAGGRLGFRV